MTRRTVTLATVVAVFLAAVPLLAGGDASAAQGHYRRSHGEPLNDPRVTPGSTFVVSTATVCRSGYASSVRDVPESEEDLVYAEYGILHHATNQYEVDHLIPLELGGNNAVSNLWPEPNDHPRGYLNSKDILENRLHALVCARTLPLSSAQSQIASDWVLAYHTYFGAWPSGRASALGPTTTRGPVRTSPSPTTGVRITIDVASVSPGGTETLHAHSSRPADSCTLVVILPSGRTSSARGLGPTAADARGDATWTWTIGSRTGAGIARVTVTCDAGVARSTFVVT